MHAALGHNVPDGPAEEHLRKHGMAPGSSCLNRFSTPQLETSA
jgi:hypothetical protein